MSTTYDSYTDAHRMATKARRALTTALDINSREMFDEAWDAADDAQGFLAGCHR